MVEKKCPICGKPYEETDEPRFIASRDFAENFGNVGVVHTLVMLCTINQAVDVLKGMNVSLHHTLIAA